MRILAHCFAIATVAAVALLAAPGFAQAPCPEGKTASGRCVDASLARLMRESVRVLTQPRLSYSGPAVVPSKDSRYDVLRDWGQGLTREIYDCVPSPAGGGC